MAGSKGLPRTGHPPRSTGAPRPGAPVSAALRTTSGAHDTVTVITGLRPALFRLPYGVMPTAAHLAARRLGRTPVLWPCWGADWTARATAESVHSTVARDLDGGATILLHDSDRTSAPGARHPALDALPRILDTYAERGFEVGLLCDHGWPPPSARSPGTLRGRRSSTVL
ncbi:hypothetical protein [Streptomyces argyrophylli]|uniref:hypothetical protein n=1 Tax=Streptomyces argyrophylli TaxID=2726118 RepID=UPI00286916FA|nr:hypothetical protein [Streptomyces argyrophyllae]